MLNEINETFKIIYNSIDEMEATINEQRAEIKRIRIERDDAQVDQRLIEELWERRTEMTEIKAQIKLLREQRDEIIKERDEARREVCRLMSMFNAENSIEIAASRSWDCFKEEETP